MTGAQKIFLRYGGDESSATAYTADYTAFYQGMQTWGRYQLLPSTEGADLVIFYSVFCRDECSITVYDGKTMAWIGVIDQYLGGSSVHVSNKTRINGAAKFIKTLHAYAGTSPSATAALTQQPLAPPILPLPTWAGSSVDISSAPTLAKRLTTFDVQLPGTPAFQSAFLAWVKTAHTVLVVDEGLTMSQNSPFKRKDALTLYENDLSAWGRYKLVSSLADADLVIDLDATSYCKKDLALNCENDNDPRYYDNSFNIKLRDPKTLRVLTYGSFQPNVYFKKKQPDPFPSSVRYFFGAFQEMVSDPPSSGE